MLTGFNIRYLVVDGARHRAVSCRARIADAFEEISCVYKTSNEQMSVRSGAASGRAAAACINMHARIASATVSLMLSRCVRGRRWASILHNETGPYSRYSLSGWAITPLQVRTLCKRSSPVGTGLRPSRGALAVIALPTCSSIEHTP